MSLTEFVYQLKLEAMLANALALEGLTPYVLVQPGSWIPKRYFGAFGLGRRQLLELPEFVEPGADERAREDAEALVGEQVSFADVRRLTYRGVPVGRHVLSTISRALHEGRVDFADPEARRRLKALLPGVLRSTHAAERLLETLRPELLLFVERNYAAEAPLSDVALDRDVNVIQFVSGFQDDALVFKRYTAETRGLHPRSLSDRSWELVRAMPWTERHERELDDEFRRRYDNSQALSRRNQEWTRPYRREELFTRLGLDPARRTAVVFSHILWDANMFFGFDLFPDQEEWFVETLRAACDNDAVNWIIKLHPGNVWKLKREGIEGELGEMRAIRERIGPLPAHVAVLPADADVNPRSVFDITDWGVTIRGSIGIELPCFGVPVLTAGTGFYSGRGFTVDSGSAREYLERLRTIEKIRRLGPGEVELARRHAYALFRRRGTRFTTFTTRIRPVAEMGHPLDHDLVVNVRSRAELERAPDLRRFAEWAVRSREPDYLEPLGQ